jgi:hypothetical protein
MPERSMIVVWAPATTEGLVGRTRGFADREVQADPRSSISQGAVSRGKSAKTR